MHDVRTDETFLQGNGLFDPAVPGSRSGKFDGDPTTEERDGH